MAQVEMPLVPPRPVRSHALVRALSAVAVLGLLAFVGMQLRALLREYRGLQEQERRLRMTNAIGYSDIHPVYNYAVRPADWRHDEGSQTLLWAGWRDGRHDWFRIDQADLPRGELSEPMGRDVIRAIDSTLLEAAGGPHWSKIPDEVLVAGLERGGERVVYPMLVLSKVEVVNDQIGGTPVLILFRPFVDEAEAVSAFDPMLDGQRITMGLTGYLVDRRPLLYDRGTRSFWDARGPTLTAIAGPRKGASLPRVDGLEVSTWSAWRSRYPGSRLVVGADRSVTPPPL